MTADGRGAPPRPVFMGCFGLFAVAVVAIGAIAFLFVFTGSSGNSGRLELRAADSYALGTVEFVRERNLYLVRLADGSFYALSDLDAANRAAEGTRCRVQPLAANDPLLPDLLDRFEEDVSAEASGSTLLFREACNEAVYDVTGKRLDAEGRNLDRFPVEENGAGNVVVDLRRRVCSENRDGESFREAACR